MHTRLIVLVVALVAAGAAFVAVRANGPTMRSDYCDPPRQVHAMTAPLPEPEAISVGFEVVAAVEGAVGMTDVGDGRMFVVSKAGLVWQVRADQASPEVVVDLTGEVATGIEQGLLGVAVSAVGDQVFLSATFIDGTAGVVAFRLSEDGVDAKQRREVYLVDDPDPTHNGGRIAVGADGMLFLALGDGGNGDETGAAQDLGSPFGKLLRIDPSGGSGGGFSVPDDNPYVGQEGALGEVWASGMRNPWGWSIDEATGDLWFGDVGHLCFEEITMAPEGGRGMNFGWSHLEGAHDFLGPVLAPGGEPDHDTPIADLGARPDDLVPPLLEVAHGPEACSILGGFVYRGDAIPTLRGRYLFGDLCTRTLYTLRAIDDTWYVGELVGQVPPGTVSFGQDRDGEVYLLSLSDGAIRIVPG